MNHPNLKKNKCYCYFEKLLKSKTVQLVTFIVKDYVACDIHMERPLNNNAQPLPDSTTLIDMLHKSRPPRFVSERSVLFRPRSNRASSISQVINSRHSTFCTVNQETNISMSPSWASGTIFSVARGQVLCC